MSLQSKTQHRIERITAALEEEYGLSGWLNIRHIFDTGYDGDTALDNDGNSQIYSTTAITTTSWKYRTCRIRWYLNTAAPQSDHDLTLIATHEYLHALLAPLTAPHPKAMAADLEEFVVECITRVIGRARGMDGIH